MMQMKLWNFLRTSSLLLAISLTRVAYSSGECETFAIFDSVAEVRLCPLYINERKVYLSLGCSGKCLSLKAYYSSRNTEVIDDEDYSSDQAINACRRFKGNFHIGVNDKSETIHLCHFKDDSYIYAPHLVPGN